MVNSYKHIVTIEDMNVDSSPRTTGSPASMHAIATTDLRDIFSVLKPTTFEIFKKMSNTNEIVFISVCSLFRARCGILSQDVVYVLRRFRCSDAQQAMVNQDDGLRSQDGAQGARRNRFRK